jgi:hypothetical protein
MSARPGIAAAAIDRVVRGSPTAGRAYQLRAESSVTYSDAWARRTNAYSLPPGSQVSARTKPPRNGARRAGSIRSNVRLPRCRSRPRLTIVEPAVNAADCARKIGGDVAFQLTPSSSDRNSPCGVPSRSVPRASDASTRNVGVPASGGSALCG